MNVTIVTYVVCFAEKERVCLKEIEWHRKAKEEKNEEEAVQNCSS